MSRTDKDAPHWVRALNHPLAREYHSLLCEHSAYGLGWPSRQHPCDLTVAAVPAARNTRCGYWVNDRTRFYTATSPGADRLHLYYYRPERAAVRDSLRNAARDYNTHGETDVEPPTRATRNSTWYGGYWD